MPIEDAQRMVTTLEKSSLYVKQIELLEISNMELLKQTELLKEQVKLLQETLVIKQKELEQSTALLEKQKELYDMKIKDMEKSEFGFFDKLILGTVTAGGGLLLGLLLLL